MPNIWVILIIVFSSLLKGVTGFGFALFALPLLLHWYAPTEIIPILTICNLVASVFIILQKKECPLLDKSSYVLIGAGGVFTVAGILALSSLNAHMLVRGAGVFFIIITVISLRKTKVIIKPLRYTTHLTAGALIGFLAGAISVGGPPLALFLKHTQVSNRKFRETFAWFGVITASIAIIGYYHTHLLTRNSLSSTLVFVPMLLAGTIIGKRLNGRLSTERFQYLNTILTLISSILLVAA